MKCYYEILEIAREADDGEIKTAYRKLALKWHPDKNIDNTEEAKEQFQLVQQAYEVLSDRQERAWYDNHREQILRGSNTDFKDDSLDVYPYFTTQCFRGYSDDDAGFYAVYRKVFEKITTEDIEHMESKSDFDEIPTFGNSASDYDDIVGPFYAYWSSYTTKKSYVWLDPYNIKEARTGRVLKLIEKENKKIRQKAKKERNEEIRNLVAFVRKRDKRVIAHTKLLEAKVVENRLKHEEIRKQKILENKKELDNSQHAEWSKFDNVKKELKEIEKHLAKQFGENLSDSELSNSEDEEDNSDLYCVACNKVFKTPKAFANHESSKKHKENVEILKQTMIDEENECENLESNSVKSETTESEEEISDLYCVVCKKQFKTPKALSNHETSKKHLENVENLYKDEENNTESVENISVESDQDNLENIDEELSDAEASETPVSNGTKKKNKKSKKVIRIQKLSMTEDSELSEAEQKTKINLKVASDDDFDFGSAKKSKKKNKQKPDNIKPENQENETQKTDAENLEVPETQNKKRVKKSQKKIIPPVVNISDLEDLDITHCCVICKNNFSSKNKLFEHLKKTGHTVAIDGKPTKSRKKQVK